MLGLAFGLGWFTSRPGAARTDLSRTGGLLQEIRRQRAPLLGCILLANAPDIDYLFGISAGNLNLYHQQYTHSILFVSALVLGILAVWQRRRPGPLWPRCAFLLTLGLSHLLLDLVTRDAGAPFGIPALWPFSDHWVYWPDRVIFTNMTRQDLASILTWHNLYAVTTETLITLPLPLGVLLYKRSRPYP